MDSIKTLAELCSLYLPCSGGDDNVKRLLPVIKKYTSNITVTKGGSIIATLGDGKDRAIIDAHFDEVSFVVTEIKGSFVKIASPFGADVRVLPASQLVILGKKEVKGVCFCMPPHLLDSARIGKTPLVTDIFVDTGLSERTLKSLVSVGDPVCYARRFEKLSKKRYLANALDDRIGCLLNIMLLERLSSSLPEGKSFDFAFVSEEEAGLRGAKTAGFGKGYSKALVFDVTFASAPKVASHKSKPLGSGAAIGVSPLLFNSLSNELKSTAKKNGIPFTLEVMGGRTGTDADAISVREGGIPTALISVPIRNMHSTAELCDIDDINAAAELAYRFLGGEI